MKKIRYYDETSDEWNSIFTELPGCFGCQYIAQTPGIPITDEDDPDFIQEAIEAQMADCYTWQEADEDDMAYVMGLAKSWGIA